MTKAERRLLICVANILMQVVFWRGVDSNRGHEIFRKLKDVQAEKPDLEDL